MPKSSEAKLVIQIEQLFKMVERNDGEIRSVDLSRLGGWCSVKFRLALPLSTTFLAELRQIFPRRTLTVSDHKASTYHRGECEWLKESSLWQGTSITITINYTPKEELLLIKVLANHADNIMFSYG